MHPRYALTAASWLSRDDYPFESRWMDTSEGRMHYIDEGKGHPIVFVHGGPTWSFLYRQLITNLRRDYRCIAIDHLGFGLSDKPEKADYKPSGHTRRLGLVLDQLEITDATVVAHDIGGPIALAWAMEQPDRMRDYILFNTWMWSLKDDLCARQLKNLITNPINVMWQRVLETSPKFFLPVLFADGYKMPNTIQDQYLGPFKDVRQRRGAIEFARALVKESAWFEDLWARRRSIADKRALLLWGMNDPWHGPAALDRWANALPMTQVVPLEGIGNYVPEQAPWRSVWEIRAFLSDATSLGAATSVPA